MEQSRQQLGRGPVATQDMRRRIAALRDQGADLVDTLWDRYHVAVNGEGFRYDYADP